MSHTAHVDTFARDNLPPKAQWPEFLFELPELQYPGRLNCATELLDKPVTRGHGHRVALRSPDGECTYTQLFTQANRIANVLVREMGLKPGNRVLLRGPNNPMMAACRSRCRPCGSSGRSAGSSRTSRPRRGGNAWCPWACRWCPR